MIVVTLWQRVVGLGLNALLCDDEIHANSLTFAIYVTAICERYLITWCLRNVEAFSSMQKEDFNHSSL